MNLQEISDVREISKVQKLENEYELKKASLLERKLRLLAKEDPEMKILRSKLRRLIESYEKKAWSDLDKISNSMIESLDEADEVLSEEQVFINKRKNAIRKKLKYFEMTQQELGLILGHSKSYMSELINGVSHFSLKDLIIIHRILGVNLKTLIPTYLQSETRERVSESLIKLNKPRLKLRKSELI